MLDSLHPLLHELLSNNDLPAAVLVTVIVLPVLLFLFRTQLKNWRQEHNIRKVIRRLGVRSMKNIHLPDGMGGEVTIAHLLLGRDAILVIGVMRFEGLIFGSPHTDQWTQVLNRRSYKFVNPDHYMQRQINAVRLIAPGAPVWPRLKVPQGQTGQRPAAGRCPVAAKTTETWRYPETATRIVGTACGCCIGKIICRFARSIERLELMLAIHPTASLRPFCVFILLAILMWTII